MKSKYFTVEVKPIIPATDNGQHAAFADGEILFDWTAFEVPRGGGKLIGVTVEMRPKGDANSTVQPTPALELVFAKSKPDGTAPSTLGVEGAAPVAPGVIGTQAGLYLGNVPIINAAFNTDLDSLTVGSVAAPNGMVLHPEPISGSNVGVDTLYVGGLAGANFNFVSGATINAGDLTGPTLTVADVDPRLFIAVGDTIVVCDHDTTTAQKAVGVVKSFTDANTLVLEEACDAVVDDDIIYNVSPIRIVLTFEK